MPLKKRSLMTLAALLGAAACSSSTTHSSGGDVELSPMNKPQVDVVGLGVVPVRMDAGDLPKPDEMPTPPSSSSSMASRR